MQLKTTSPSDGNSSNSAHQKQLRPVTLARFKPVSLLLLLFLTLGFVNIVNAQSGDAGEVTRDEELMILHFTTTAANQTIELPLNGDFDVTVDWDDEAVEEYSTDDDPPSHIYAAVGTYTVSIAGALEQFGNDDDVWAGAEFLTEVSSFGELGLTSLSGAFFGASNLITVPAKLPENSSVTNMSFMFSGCSYFNQDISGWDVSNVEFMYGMFSGFMYDDIVTIVPMSFNKYIGGWEVGNVTDMSEMFAGCSNFNQDISGWDVRNVEFMYGMFSGVMYDDFGTIVPMSFNKYIGGWEVGNVIDMSEMFAGCSDFNQDISDWDVSSVESMYGMFSGFMYDDIVTIVPMSFNKYIGGWEVGNVTDMSEMFAGCSNFNQDISGWDVRNVEFMYGMFSGVMYDDFGTIVPMSFNKYIGGWEVGNVIDMSEMFAGCSDFNQDISDWDVSSVESMYGMFSGVVEDNDGILHSVTMSFDQNIGNWDVSNVQGMDNMFAGVTLSTANYDALLIGWAAQEVQDYVVLDGGNSKYSAGAATAARAKLINSNNWEITDGGFIPHPMVLHFTTTAANQKIELPLNGDFAVTVVYGDDPEDSVDYTNSGPEVSFTFAAAGTYTVSISGELEQFGNSSNGWVGAEYLTHVSSFGTLGLTSLSGAFKGASNLTAVPAYLPYLSNLPDDFYVTDMSRMFAGCSIFDQDIGGWDVSNVDNMTSMFSGATAFNQLIGNWDVSNVKTMTSMFSGATAFNQPIGNWDVSKVEDMESMFLGATAFNQPLGNWDVEYVDNMTSMFSGATAFNQPIGNWNVGNVVTMTSMFSGATAFNQPLGDWVVGYVVTMTSMFSGATAFNQPLGDWSVGNVTTMENMFAGVTLSKANYNALLSGWAAQENLQYEVVFDGGNSKYSAGVAYAHDILINDYTWTIIDGGQAEPDPMVLHFTTTQDSHEICLPLSGKTVDCTVNWGDGNEQSFKIWGNACHTFAKAGTYTVRITGALTQFGYSNTGNECLTEVSSFGDLGLTSLSGAFNGASNLKKVPAYLPENFNVTDMSDMFRICPSFNQDISSWNVVNVTNMNGMFDRAYAFNQNIGGWDVSNVTDMTNMFRDAFAFNQNIGRWNVEKVEKMNNMFCWATGFNQDIGGWNVGNVIEMQSMFNSATAFNQNIGGWNVGKVENTFDMFFGATAFNQDISGWDVSKVTYMYGMFDGCSSFNGDVSSWDVRNVTNMIFMFRDVTLSTATYDALLKGWAAQTVKNGVTFYGGNSKYSAGTATEARGILTTRGWNIDDGGPANIFTWNGSEDSDWEKTNNWTHNEDAASRIPPKVPGKEDDAIIDVVDNGKYYPVIEGKDNTGVHCHNLTINEGASLTVVLAEGNKNNSEEPIDNQGLITNAPITNNGTINIKKTISQDNQWHFISMPGNNILAGQHFTGMYLQEWNEVSAKWLDIIPVETPLNVMQGYSLYSPEQKGDKTFTFTFTGLQTPNTGVQRIPITYTETDGDNKGANLLGNPYPSYVDWSRVYNYGAKYTWNGVDYDAYTPGGNGPGSRFLNPMEGFFIITEQKDEPETFTLNNSQRCVTTQTVLKNSSKGIEKGLVLSTSSGEKENHLYLVFDAASSENFELSEDAWKLLSGTPGLSEVYSINADGKLSVDVRPTFETVQLGYVNDKTGIYSIGIHQIANIAELRLEDTKTNTYHNLQKGAYEFVWEEGDSETRFKLHFNSLGISEPQISQSNILVFAADQQIFIKGAEAGNVQVTDLMGRHVLEQNINGGLTVLSANLVTGIYIVSVKTAHEIKSVKVFIK